MAPVAACMLGPLQYGGSSGCSAAQGIDVFVAINQSTDKTGESYGQLDDVIRAAVCAVDWDEVEPYPQFVLLAQLVD